jgi:hypothetical protein
MDVPPEDFMVEAMGSLETETTDRRLCVRRTTESVVDTEQSQENPAVLLECVRGVVRINWEVGE